MVRIRLEANPKGIETARLLREVGRGMGLTFVKQGRPYTYKINYGVSNFNHSKDKQAELLRNIIPNTLIYPHNYEDLDDYTNVIVKNPTRLLLWKDAKNIPGAKYLYIKKKAEWRINFSFDKVRGIFNKNITPYIIFGKANSTQWTSETNKKTRGTLIELTKKIAAFIQEDYDLQNFGLDIIQEEGTDKLYFLELNQANAMNEEQCTFFLKGFLSKNGVTLEDDEEW